MEKNNNRKTVKFLHSISGAVGIIASLVNCDQCFFVDCKSKQLAEPDCKTNCSCLTNATGKMAIIGKTWKRFLPKIIHNIFRDIGSSLLLVSFSCPFYLQFLLVHLFRTHLSFQAFFEFIRQL